MIAAVVVDIEGVVLDTENAWDRAQAELLRRRGLPYDRATLKPLLTGRSEREALRILIDHHGLDDDVATLASERRTLLEAVIDDTIEFIPGVVDALRALPLPFCAATSMAPHLLRWANAITGVMDLFGGRVITLDRVGGRGKPSPDLFLCAAQLLGAAPPDCLVVEDAPNGVAAARTAGMRCAALTTTHPRESLAGADLVVAGWHELRPLWTSVELPQRVRMPGHRPPESKDVAHA